jgi:hypothetical protein
VKLVLEVTGGFTGPAGKQRVEVDLGRLPPAEAAKLHRDLDQIPESAWGQTFTLPHPKAWDFTHKLRVNSGDRENVVTFHDGAGPEPLSRIAKYMLER